MKREGRQHGAVRCYNISPPLLARERFKKMVDSASATGLFTKVPNKPTNQSKYTGKCRNARCSGHRLHPVCKSKDKAKGNMKFKSIDPENEWTKYSFGTSATGFLAYLADEGGYNDEDYDYDYDYDYPSPYYPYTYACAYDDHDDGTHDINLRAGFVVGFGVEIAAQEHENDIDVDEIDGNDEDEEDVVEHDYDAADDDETMSFCDVGLCWGHGDGDEYGDDGWYLVGGQMQ